MNLDAENLTVPAADPTKADIALNMVPVFKLEARQQEIANVNKVTAPELMQAFIDGFGHVARMKSKLELELRRSENALEVRKAAVYLDEAPRILREKRVVRESNPGGSEDQRKAVLAQDSDYQILKERFDQIEAATEYLNLKLKFFEMAYQAVKKVYDSLSSTNAARSSGYASFGSADPASEKLTVGKPHYE